MEIFPKNKPSNTFVLVIGGVNDNWHYQQSKSRMQYEMSAALPELQGDN